MADHDHLWILRSDFEELQRSLVQLTGNMQAMERRADTAEAAVKRLEAQQKKGAQTAKGHGDALAGAEKIAKTYGGTVGNVADTVADFAEGLLKMSEALGPVGTGLVAMLGALTATVGIGLTAVKMIHDFGATAAKSGVELKQLGLATEEQARVTDVLAAAAEGLKQEINATNVDIAAMSPAIVEVSTAAVGAAVELRALLGEMKAIGESETVQNMQAIARAITAIASLGTTEAVRAVSSKLSIEGQQAAAAIAITEKLTKDLTKALKDAEAEAERLAKEGFEEAKRAAEKAAEARIAANDRVAKATAAQTVKDLDDLKRLIDAQIAGYKQAEQVRLDTIRRVEQATADQIVADLEGVKKLADAQIEQYRQQAEDAETVKAAWVDASKAILDAQFAIVGSIADAVLDSNREQIGSTQKKLDALKGMDSKSAADKRSALRAELQLEKDQARQVAQAKKALAVLEATLQATIAVATATAAAAGTFGLGAPLVIAATAAGAANVAAAIATPIPKFHDGGLAPDELASNGKILRDGEAQVILNQRAVQDGAVERAQEANRGQNSASNRELVLADAGRVVGRALLREINRPESAAALAFGSTSGQVEVGGRA